MRLSELTNLKEADVHLEDQWVKVLGKGSNERMVAFGRSQRTREWIPSSWPWTATR